PGLIWVLALGRLDTGDQILQLWIGNVLFVHRLHRLDERGLVHFVDSGTKRFNSSFGFNFLGLPELALVSDGFLGSFTHGLLRFRVQTIPNDLGDDQNFWNHQVLVEREELSNFSVTGSVIAWVVVFSAVDNAGLNAGVNFAIRHRCRV